MGDLGKLWKNGDSVVVCNFISPDGCDFFHKVGRMLWHFFSLCCHAFVWCCWVSCFACIDVVLYYRSSKFDY